MSQRLLIRLSLLASPWIFLGCTQETRTRPAEVDAEGRPIIRTLVDTREDVMLLADGIDVSHFQGEIDWAKVRAAGKVFAFHKATEGIDYVDPMFATNWPAIRAAGISRGAYHFFRARDDAEAQADLFIKTVELLPGDLAPVIDVEMSEGQSTEKIDAGVLTWIDKIQAHYGVRPIIYSGKNFAERELASGFTECPLWLAQYTDTPPEAVGGWSKWTFWQHTDNGTVDGVEGEVDLNKYRGTALEWSALVIPKPAGSRDASQSPIEHRSQQPEAG